MESNGMEPVSRIPKPALLQPMQMRTWQWLLAAIIATIGIAAYAMPWMRAMEQALGLQYLFAWRGPLLPPAEAVIIALDQESALQLKLPKEINLWPRSVYAQLIKTSKDAGAKAIALDIYFAEPREAAEDRLLAENIVQAGNVILCSSLKRQKNHGADPSYSSADELARPLPVLADAAAMVAPYILPKIPARVDAFWAFVPIAAGMPSLPVATLSVYAQSQPSVLLGPMDAGVKAWMYAASIEQEMRTTMPRYSWKLARSKVHGPVPALGNAQVQMDPQDSYMISLLLGLIDSNDVRYLNFYGPPRTIKTIPAYQLLQGYSTHALAGKAVFIGRSETDLSDQRDGFMTVFSRNDGLDLSGVEIAATAFANLLHGTSLKPLPTPGIMAGLALYGLVTAMLVSSFVPLAALMIALALALAWLLLTFEVFQHAIWLPWLIPVFLQTPLALLGSLFGQYWENGRERQRIQQAFSRYLPQHVVDQLVHQTGAVSEERQLVFGVCLASDAGSYTSLAETMTPHDLHQLMNQYYQTLFSPVRKHGGIISDVVGDAMLALWPGVGAEHTARQAACAVALEIITQLERFSSLQDHKLNTRIGLHAGDLVLGNVGAVDHYEYRPVGDIVNTSTRIEGLNKLLGTRILASAEVTRGLEDFIWRPMGRFRLAGKRNPIEIHELMGSVSALNSASLLSLRDQFSTALALFQRGDFTTAQSLWLSIKQTYPDDQPTRFYLNECMRYLGLEMEPDAQGIIIVCEK